MFFFRNKHIMVDLGTGNNNKINWALDDKQEMIDLVEVNILSRMYTNQTNILITDCIPWCKKRQRFSGVTKRLFNKVPILKKNKKNHIIFYYFVVMF